jgi:hypothetical protein
MLFETSAPLSVRALVQYTPTYSDLIKLRTNAEVQRGLKRANRYHLSIRRSNLFLTFHC